MNVTSLSSLLRLTLAGSALGVLVTAGGCAAPADETEGEPMQQSSSEALVGQVTKTFQNGVAPSSSYAGAHDTLLKQSAATTNFAATTPLRADSDAPSSSGKDIVSLLQWDVSSIPATSTVRSAQIAIQVTNASPQTYALYEVTRAWTDTEATWQRASAASAWETAGAKGATDHGTTVLGSIAASGTGAYTVALNAAGVAVVQDWVSGKKPNHGFIVVAGSNNDGVEFASSEAATASSRPALSVGYDAASTKGAAQWILDNFAGVPVKTGTFTSRQTVETPALVRSADASNAKYGFDFHETSTTPDPRIGMIDVKIHDLVSPDAYGGGFVTANAPGATTFLKNVTIDPKWPNWVSYATTNRDGMVLDGSAAIYGEDVQVLNWNGDAGIDNKALVSQFVRLTLAPHGNRGIRYWHSGPHYLVDSSLQNTGDLGDGAIFWFHDCSTAEVRIYDSTFNGQPTIAPNLISCDTGSNPKIVYLTTDPRTTGEMHPMFSY